MALDVFGNELYFGDVVVYADARLGTSDVALDVYVVVEEIDKDTLKGQLINGPYAGDHFYLTKTDKRASLIRNVYKTAQLNEETTLN